MILLKDLIESHGEPANERSLINKLKKYKSDENIFIHFGNTEKVGIHPSTKTGGVSEKTTPLGVYAHSLKWVLRDFKQGVKNTQHTQFKTNISKQTLMTFGFTNEPYAHILLRNENSNGINLAKTTNKEIAPYLQKIFWHWLTVNEVEKVLDGEKGRPGQLFIEWLNNAAKKSKENPQRFKTKALLSCGIHWLYDSGKDILYDEGGVGMDQIVFLTPKAYTHVETIQNKRSVTAITAYDEKSFKFAIQLLRKKYNTDKINQMLQPVLSGKQDKIIITDIINGRAYHMKFHMDLMFNQYL